jgi:hypothetical protein
MMHVATQHQKLRWLLPACVYHVACGPMVACVFCELPRSLLRNMHYACYVPACSHLLVQQSAAGAHKPLIIGK